MAVISKGITLSYKNGSVPDFIQLNDLMEIPELNGDTEAIEITTLADAAHMYTDGIKNYGDSLAFKFLYASSQFMQLNGGKDESWTWQVTLPDSTKCTFSGTHSVKLDGVGVNAALTYTLNIKPNSEMSWGNV